MPATRGGQENLLKFKQKNKIKNEGVQIKGFI